MSLKALGERRLPDEVEHGLEVLPAADELRDQVVDADQAFVAQVLFDDRVRLDGRVLVGHLAEASPLDDRLQGLARGRPS